MGEQLHNPDMAETLTLLAADPAGFYTNHLAHEFIEAAQAVNNVTGKRGLITAADMRAYRAVYREPVRYNFHREGTEAWLSALNRAKSG